MRTQAILILILTFGLLGCSNKESGITINGKINGKLEKVEYTTPINGKWYYGNKQSITTDTTGVFQIEMEIEEPSFITIYVPGKASGVLLVEPGKTYDVNIQVELDQKKFLITSGDSIAQNFYNTLPAPDFYMLGLNEFYKDSIPPEISDKINTLKEKEIAKFNGLLENNKISEDFYKLATLDRKIYYSALEAGAAGLLLRKNLNLNDTIKIEKITDFWDDQINISGVEKSNYAHSPWFYALVYNSIWFSRYSTEKPNREAMKKMYDTAKLLTYNVDEAKKYLSGKELEYYLASYIYLESWQTSDNAMEIIEIYKNFKNEYPESPYNKYLASSVEPIIDFHQKLKEKQINEEIRVVENYQEINSFEELTKKFQGQKFFVDIWGTWCGPCKKEFEHKDTLDELLKSKDMTTLYICEGQNSKEKVWKEMIKFYDLEGYHILANEKLVTDIINRFGNNGRFAYPRYLLVDENGKVVNAQASYPSKTKQLEKEINEAYVW